MQIHSPIFRILIALTVLLSVGWVWTYISLSTSDSLSARRIHPTLEEMQRFSGKRLAFGDRVLLPRWFAADILPVGQVRSRYGIESVQILREAVGKSNDPDLPGEFFEVDVELRTCANAFGYPRVIGSYSEDIAGVLGRHLYVLPVGPASSVEEEFGGGLIPMNGTAPTLLHGRPFSRAPSLTGHACFEGVLSFKVPSSLISNLRHANVEVVMTLAPPDQPGPNDDIVWTQ